MLEALHIENVAVIRCADIAFSSGFSVLSGETGAGKSILIDSIGFLLGRRGGRELVRTGSTRATVTALFTGIDPRTEARLSAEGIEILDGELTLERAISAEGRTSARACGRPITLSQLRAVGELLVNIHGQNDTHTLTLRENQLAILDGFAENAALLSEYRAVYERFSAVNAEIREISTEEAARLRELEMLNYQILEIEALALRAGEEDELTEKRKRLRSSERIAKQATFAYRALRAAEKANVLYVLDRAVSAVSSLSDVISEAEEIATELIDCRSRIEDAAERIRELCEDDAVDAERALDAVEGRLSAIERLRRKYGGTVEEILHYLANAKERYERLSRADERLSELTAERADLLLEATRLAERLTEARTAAGRVLSERVLSVLSFLDMPRVRFEVAVRRRFAGEERDLRRDGGDDVELLIATNPGEPLAPLSAIASGGELARIMLSIKSVIADRDGIGTVIYDEIDAGVSGKTARKLGIELLRSSSGAQVLCVTHSAQIASLADEHFLIKKVENEGRAETEVSPLDEEGRITELSRILGGIEVTDAQRRAAWELYTERSEYKRS